MSLTALAFILLYIALAIASVIKHPVFGIIGYYVTYIISPATRWWGESLAARGFRYSFIMAGIAVVGLVLYAIREKTEKRISGQEVFLWLFVGVVWLAGVFTPPIAGGEDQALKLAKAAVMLFVLKRSVSDLDKFRWVIWALILASTYGAMDTRFMAARIGSRIQTGAGGSDFIEGNFLAAHLVMMLPFIGALLLRSKWIIKVLLAASSALIMDVIIQCRSRGAFLALLGGAIVALLFAPRKTRKAIFALTLAGAIGAFILMDTSFLNRMSTINPALAVEVQDSSSVGRILAWRAAISMAADHPFGIGFNNFKPRVMEYAPLIPGKDTHNTYLRCLAELGVQGLILMALLITNALLQFYRIHSRYKKDSPDTEHALWSYAAGVGLTIYLIAGMFISTTYIEEFYMILLLPDLLASLNVQKSDGTSQTESILPIEEVRA